MGEIESSVQAYCNRARVTGSQRDMLMELGATLGRRAANWPLWFRKLYLIVYSWLLQFYIGALTTAYQLMGGK
jgi:hypothetical protein